MASACASTAATAPSRYSVRRNPARGFVDLGTTEQAELGGDGEAEGRGGTAQPGHVSDQRHTVPTAEVPRAEFCVVPHGAGVEAGEVVGSDVEQAQLSIESERRLDIRHHDVLVVLRGDLAVR